MKNEVIFYLRILQLSRAVQFTYRSQKSLKLKMCSKRLTPNKKIGIICCCRSHSPKCAVLIVISCCCSTEMEKDF